jgi:hypothetical protein
MNEVPLSPSFSPSGSAEIGQLVWLTGFQDFEKTVQSDPDQIGFTAKELASILGLSFDDEDY